jgi:hypothetical protein
MGLLKLIIVTTVEMATLGYSFGLFGLLIAIIMFPFNLIVIGCTSSRKPSKVAVEHRDEDEELNREDSEGDGLMTLSDDDILFPPENYDEDK